MPIHGMKPATKLSAHPRFALAVALFAAAVSVVACGGDTTAGSTLDRSGIVVDQSSAYKTITPVPTRTPAARSDARNADRPSTVDIVSAQGQFALTDIEKLEGFKKNKQYDVAGLRDATAAVYGFFGADPYNRHELEIRFYPDHATALDSGVDYADEATGPTATLSSSTQRWDEGITQRRACRANTRGSHHTGRCDAAKYGDYIVLGNLIILCEGIDSETALRNCNKTADALQ